MAAAQNWTTITESHYPWEAEALAFVRERLPKHEPYWAWSNFEFIADDGSINEVDLLVFSPQGFFLVEIKSRGGELAGDAGTWLWSYEGRTRTLDNPLILTNSKAKKLKSLLQHQPAARKASGAALPFIEPLVFCSASDLRLRLKDRAAFGVCLRDGEVGKPGIMAALQRRECPGLDARTRGTHDRPTLKLLKQCLESAGIRRSAKSRMVSDYELEELISEGPNYQDWSARHSKIAKTRRLVRLYLVRHGASPEERQIIDRAATREFKLLENLNHPNILKASQFSQHEVGPAVVFEYQPESIRLDHYLRERASALSVDCQLALLRQVAEVVRFAHERHVVHRSLSAQSILVVNPEERSPRIKVCNWQSGYLEAHGSSNGSTKVTATCHVEQLVDDATTAYMAPELLSDPTSASEQLDVFSLGALAYHVFSGQAPAANGLELSEKLRNTSGLRISAIMNGAAQAMQELIEHSTHPAASERFLETAVEFLVKLDELENELTTPEHELVEDPTIAQSGDKLPHGFSVIRRLGQGGSSVALLVDRDGEEYVIKAANDLSHNDRLKDEGEVLAKLRHQCIVEYCETLTIGDRTCLLMRQAGTETLGQRLRKEGRLHIDLLQRFGEDLLEAVKYLEDQGIPHRDIKPDNIGVGKVGRGSKLHLILFDFSLSRAKVENIRAGTPGYLEPLLPLRKRWDLHAERYAAAATLYELTTGILPKWSDGTSDPSHLDCEITIDAESFEPALRDGFVQFFTTAFRRNVTERYDNAEQMLEEWRECFKGIEDAEVPTDHESEEQLRALLADASFDTPIIELGLGTRARNALDRKNILKVSDLLSYPIKLLIKQRGVGNKTKREIAATSKLLRERLGTPGSPAGAPVDGVGSIVTSLTEDGAAELQSIDLLAKRLLTTGSRSAPAEQGCLQALLGLDMETGAPVVWPSQTELASQLGVTRQRIQQVVAGFQERWKKFKGLTSVRDDIATILAKQGGVMTLSELRDALLTARGSVEEEPKRGRLAIAVIRASIEVERNLQNPRFLQRRTLDQGVLIALDQALGGYALQLAKAADEIAGEDPLASPARVLERLREVSPPAGADLSDLRLLRLASAVSERAALSSKLEIYPRGMPAERALRLSQGAILTIPKKGKDFSEITIPQIRERVESRYPLAEPLPFRPELDALIAALDFDLEYNPSAADGTGAYVTRSSISSGTRSLTRLQTYNGPLAPEAVTPEVADARHFEERLVRAHREGAFLCLVVPPKHYERARQELASRFPTTPIHVEELFLASLREAVTKAGVSWDLVLKTDAAPNKGDWDNLILLVRRAMPAVEQRIRDSHGTVVMAFAGILARYDQMGILEQLRDHVGHPGWPQGAWLLVPGDAQAQLEGKAVPVLSPAQRVRVPETWLKNEHRAAARKAKK